MTFTVLFATCATVLFLLWHTEHRKARFWREQSDRWKRMHRSATEGWGESRKLARFWMEEAPCRRPPGKPKEVPRT